MSRWVATLLFVCFIHNYSLNAERLRLSCAQIKTFVNGHNLRRQLATQGLVPRQPPGNDIAFMVWNEELAEKAAKWAENGIFAHNPDRTIGSNRWSLVGENVYMSTFYSSLGITVAPNIEEALNSWFNEYENYVFQPYVLGTTKPIGHYTQMVWANSNRIGCGISQKKQNGWTYTLFVCDYGPTGNFIGQVPYRTNGQKGFLRCIDNNCKNPYGIYC